MSGMDEIIFTGEYKGFRLGIRFDLPDKEPAYVASALAYISAQIEPHAFGFSGIDTRKVSDFARPQGKGLGAVYGFLESTGPGAIKEGLSKALPEPALMSVAESYLFNRLLENAGVAFKVSAEPSIRPADEEIGDFIGFIGRYGSWMAIKKLGLGNVQDYEVSGILGSIDFTIVNKAFEFSGARGDDAVVEPIVRGKRKSFNNAAAALRELEKKLTGGPQDAYLVCKTLEALDLRPYASPQMLTNAHPDIKPPKVRGRKPKG